MHISRVHRPEQMRSHQNAYCKHLQKDQINYRCFLVLTTPLREWRSGKGGGGGGDDEETCVEKTSPAFTYYCKTFGRNICSLRSLNANEGIYGDKTPPQTVATSTTVRDICSVIDSTPFHGHVIFESNSKWRTLANLGALEVFGFPRFQHFDVSKEVVEISAHHLPIRPLI